MSIRLHHKHLCESVGDDANKPGPARSPCSISVSHPSVFTLQWSEGFKISSPLFFSFFFHPSTFKQAAAAAAAAAAVEPLEHPPSFTHKFLIWLNMGEKKNISGSSMRGSGHCPAWSVTEFVSRSNVSALQTSSLYGGGRGCSSSRMALWRENEAGSLTTWSPPGDLPPFPLSAGNET